MLRVNHFIPSILFTLFILCNIHTPASAQIDLHAHLHMKPGMGAMIKGDFNQAPTADRWSDRFQMRASGKSLAESSTLLRPKLIIMSFYGHPYFAYSLSRDGLHFDRRENARNAVEREYQEFKTFIDQHSDHFKIVRNANEARSIIQSGKTAIVLSLEGAWGHLESTEDFNKWVNERGLAIVTPVHLTPDELGGNALMSTIISLANSTFDFIASVWQSRGLCLKTFCKSTEGFSPAGVKLVDELMNRKVWIDFSHANEIEVNSLLPKLEKNNLPLIATHTQLRDFYPVERGLGNAEINYIRKHDGIIGLIPSQQMIPAAMKQAHDEALITHPEEKDAASAAKGLSCISSLNVFKKTVAYAIATLGAPERVALASDINAPLDGLSPACGDVLKLDESMRDLYLRGYYTYSQWNTLVRFTSPEENWSDRNLEHFLTLWERVRNDR